MSIITALFEMNEDKCFVIRGLCICVKTCLMSVVVYGLNPFEKMNILIDNYFCRYLVLEISFVLCSRLVIHMKRARTKGVQVYGCQSNGSL